MTKGQSLQICFKALARLDLTAAVLGHNEPMKDNRSSYRLTLYADQEYCKKTFFRNYTYTGHLTLS